MTSTFAGLAITTLVNLGADGCAWALRSAALMLWYTRRRVVEEARDRG